MHRDHLKSLWDYRHRGYARRFWEDWYERAMSSGLEPLRQFARRLKPYLPGIFAGPWAPIRSKASTTGSR
ncbi:transposase (fragment) (plasmid) [Cupriavidus taiwanensis]|uniref:Transposase n=1 Tax=Cupriavidus taiwanensis TaxID=164546 RepID=A0A375I8W4_9BURK